MKRITVVVALAAAGLALILLNTAATAEMTGIATSKETLSKRYGHKAYSPYAQRNFPAYLLWGDKHLHTSL